MVAALLGNLLIAVIKFFAAWRTGSSAILTEGVHSLVDTGDQVLLLYGMHRAARPPDEQFPFGHGKEIYFWSFVVAILIFALGAGVSIYEGILHLLHPNPLENPSINYLIIVGALFFEGVSWGISLREFKKEKKKGLGYVEAIHKAKDPTVFVVLMEDSAALIGLLVALTGIALTQWTGNPAYDGTASVLIGVVLAMTAIILANETKGLLIGEAADSETVRLIREVVGSGKNVKHVNEVLTLHMGPDFIVATASLDFADQVPVGEVERNVAELEEAIRKQVPAVKRVFIKAEQSKHQGSG